MMKRRSYKFTGKKHSRRGLLSFVLALCSVLSGIVMIVISFENHGNANVYIGSAGLFSMMVSAAAFVIGITSFHEESYKLFPVLGSLCSGLVLVSWVGIYIMGF